METHLCHQLAETLALRLGKETSSEHFAHVISTICLEISESLNPVLGQKGVAALFQRSLVHTTNVYPWLAAMGEDMQAPVNIENLKALLTRQSD